MNGFQKSALTSTAIVNKLATVDAAFAVSSKDLAEGLARAGAAASDAGVSFDQLLGLITAAQQTTARGGAVIGNSLKTIFTRVERRDTISAFESLGVAVRDAEGNVLSALPLLTNFAKTYDTLGGSVKKSAAELVGGVFQINILKAVLGDLAKANGIASQATEVSNAATDEAIKRNEALNQTLDSMLAKLGVTAKQVGANIGSLSFAGPVKGLLELAQNNPVTAALEDASGRAESIGGQIAQSLMKGIGGSLVYGLTPLIAGALGRVVMNTSRNVLRDFGELTKMNAESQTQARVQSEIVGLYRAGGAALQAQLAAMSAITDKAALLQRLLVSGAGSAQIPAMTNALLARGYRGQPPRAAGGYVPMAAEAAAISRGIGGAPAGARPVFLPSFNRGGGQRGIVANTSEFIVPMGAAGYGIWNRDMIRKEGLPPGAMPVAAQGYIPTAAVSFQPGDLNFKPTYLNQRGQGVMGVDLKPADLNKINELFRQLGEASGKVAASPIANEIKVFASSLDKMSKERVLLNLSDQMSSAIFRARIVSDQTRRARPETMAAFLAERQVTRDPFDTYGRYVNRRYGGDSTYNLSTISANEALQDYGHTRVPLMQGPPNPPPLLPWGQRNLRTFNRWASRLGRGVRGMPSQNAGFAAAFGLPLVGGMIDEGGGGTFAGVGRGAARSGLAAAGFGASIGLMAPGIGPLLGAGVGGMLGGVYGAVSKINKSFEELAADIQESNAKLADRITAINEVFRLDEDMKNARSGGFSTERIFEISQARRAAMSRLDPKTQATLRGRFDDPDIQAQVLGVAVGEQRKATLGQTLLGALGGATQNPFQTLSGIGFTAAQVQRATNGIIPSLSQLSNQQLADLSRLNQKDPRAALEQIGAGVGLDKGQLQDLTGPFNKASLMARLRLPRAQESVDALAELYRESISKAISRAAIMQSGEGEAADAVREALSEIQSKRLLGLEAELDLVSKLVQISATGDLRIAQARQGIALNNPRLTELERLREAARFEQINIGTEFSAERESLIQATRKDLIGVLRASGGGTPEAIHTISGLNTAADIRKLRSLISTPETPLPTPKGEALIAILDKTIQSLDALNSTEQMQIRVSREVTGATSEDMLYRRTLAGAKDEDTGALKRAQEALDAAIIRNDPSDVIEGLRIDKQRISRRGKVRSGAATPDSETRGNLRDILGFDSDQASRHNRAIIDLGISGDRSVGGSDLGSALFGEARRTGLRGDATGSFFGGFHSVIAGAKRDLLDFSEAGARVADNLQSSFTGFWGDWVTGATRGKEAFRGFVTSVLGDASRMLASKAFTAALSAIPGFTPAGSTGGEFTGARFKFAAGGAVPALLTGGEYVIGPNAAKRIGYDTLRRLNGYAEGGTVRGGSGVKDDVPANLPPGSFVVRKSAAQRLGTGYLGALAEGRVQNRWLGGALMGALLGGGIGYATGGKQGAIGGALLGGIAGGMYSRVGPQIGFNEAGKAIYSQTPGALSTGARVAIGLGASAGLGMLAAGINAEDPESGPISLSQVPALRRQLEAEQANQFANRGAGRHAFLQINPQGGYSLAGFDMAPATRRWSEGGGVDMPMNMGAAIPAASPTAQVNMHVEFHTDSKGGITSSSNGNDPFSDGSAGRFQKVVKSWVAEELVRQSRPDGFLAQRSRFMG